jgi:hypothetical protein
LLGYTQEILLSIFLLVSTKKVTDKVNSRPSTIISKRNVVTMCLVASENRIASLLSADPIFHQEQQYLSKGESSVV